MAPACSQIQLLSLFAWPCHFRLGGRHIKCHLSPISLSILTRSDSNLTSVHLFLTLKLISVWLLEYSLDHLIFRLSQ